MGKQATYRLDLRLTPDKPLYNNNYNEEPVTTQFICRRGEPTNYSNKNI